jgi:beta-phosphoglucomutase
MTNKIKAIIFDLDGTLVQTEILKAHAYGKAMEQLSNGNITEKDVVISFGELVGLSRNEIAEKLIKMYSSLLNGQLLNDTQTAVEELIKTRLGIYHQMIFDPAVLHAYVCPFSIGLLKNANANGYTIGLATMSYAEQVSKVLDTLNLKSYFHHIITRDAVENGKPHPEIYLRMLAAMNLQPEEAIIIEDSVAGIKAAQAAGITVFGVTNSITSNAVNRSGVLDKEFIVNASPELTDRVFNYISQVDNNFKNQPYAGSSHIKE